jgi:hypothetical protein
MTKYSGTGIVSWSSGSFPTKDAGTRGVADACGFYFVSVDGVTRIKTNNCFTNTSKYNILGKCLKIMFGVRIISLIIFGFRHISFSFHQKLFTSYLFHKRPRKLTMMNVCLRHGWALCLCNSACIINYGQNFCEDDIPAYIIMSCQWSQRSNIKSSRSFMKWALLLYITPIHCGNFRGGKKL